MEVMEKPESDFFIQLLAVKTQWGKITTTEAGNNAQTYPVSYSSAAYATVVTLASHNASAWADAYMTYSSKSQFKYYCGAGTWRYISVGK